MEIQEELKSMNLPSQNILFFSRSNQHGGTENVIVQLCEIFKPLVNKIVVCTADGFKKELLADMGIKHYGIPDLSDRSPAAMAKIACTFQHIVKNERITVIHSHHRMAAFYTDLLCKKNIIKIANAHNTFADKRKFTRRAYQNTHMVAVGEKVKENLVDFYGLPEGQVTVIHNAIKPFDGEIDVVKELQTDKDVGYTLVGNIGRLSEQKGITYFIQAAAKVIKACPKTRFYIIGSGELETKLKQEARELLPEHSIKFLGYRKNIQNVISQLDFVVLSSLWEGLPLTPIEAFSVGKPVVATAVDGTVEIVQDRKNGLLVKPIDVDGLAAAMTELITNKTERKEFGKNAYRRYEEDFSFEKMAERYIGYYESIGDEQR